MLAVPFITSTPRSTQSYEPRQLLHLQNADHWQPGEEIPVNSSFARSHLNLGLSNSFDSPLGDNGGSTCTSDVEKLWEDVHSLITSKFAEMEEQWSNMCHRMQHMEEHLGTLQSTVGNLMSDSPSSSSSSSSSSGTSRGRKRKSPVNLQNKVRAIHKSFNDEDQLNLEESINSTHNREVTNKIHQEIGDYSMADIRGVLLQYRKSLKPLPKDSLQGKRASRSRQQRLWERRSRFVNDTEASLWHDITPARMSDEEPLENGKVRRKRPSWRSDTFNSLVDTLDERANASFQKSARKERILSSPMKAVAPANCPNWMMNES